MPVQTPNPEYSLREAEWKAVRDSLEGERKIKAERETYLPAPPGMSVGTNNFLENGKRITSDRYSFYLTFAEFPELPGPLLNGFQGIIHEHDPHVELPPSLEYLMEDATTEGEGLFALWRKTTREVLATGRFGILPDIGPDQVARFAPYSTENIFNWRLQTPREGNGPAMIILREISMQPSEDDEFKLEEVIQYRELRLVDGVYMSRVWEGEGQTYTAGSFEEIQSRGIGFSEIPFVCISSIDTSWAYQNIPLMPIVKRCLSIYRLTADYRRSLYIKGDPQIYISGIQSNQAPTTIGGEAIWTFPNPQAKAAYLDIDGQGIPLMAEAIEKEYERIYQEGGKLLDTAERGAESGEALRRRQAAQQVSLRDVAQNAGAGFLIALRNLAVLAGEDPNSIVFQPDLDFAEPSIQAQELMELMTSKGQGAPISLRSVHELMKRGGLTNLPYDVELEEINTEVPLLPTEPVNPEIEESGADANDE